jgi:hypothetical protein
MSLSLFLPINQVASADDTYERICLTMGWVSCGEWTIYDSNGVQKNRVVGPTPLSALVAICGVNMCGGGAGGSAVQTGTYSPPSAAELAARAASAEAARVRAEALAAEAARAAATTDTTTVLPTPTPTTSGSDSSTPTSTPSPTGVTGIGMNMFDLQGTALYARYCIQGSGNVTWSGSIKTTSIIRDAAGKVFSEKTSQWGTDGFASGMPGDCSTSYAYDEIKSGFIPGNTYTLTVNSTVAGATHSLTKSFTIAGGSLPGTTSEYQPNPSGLGGYAVVHPDGRVCGVIVGNSYFEGNDKTMTTSYMGCPVGSRVIFQTKPSPSGNVSGWHGPDVFYFNGIFVLGSGTTISNGIATDTNGRVWDTGSGATIKAGTAPTVTQTDTKTATTQTDTKTATTQTDTKTATTQTDTKTATTQTDTKTATTSVPVSADTTTATVVQLTSLTSEEKEDLLKVALKSNRSSTISIAVDIPKVNLVVTATKKGSTPITFKVKTDSEGDAQIKTKRNLAGFTVTLSIGKVKLDSDLVRK